MTNWVQHVTGGNVATDIGQIPANDKRALKKLVGLGLVLTGTSLAYPTHKTYYVSADYFGQLPGPLHT